MLDDFILPSYANRVSLEEGSDSLASRIKDKNRFQSWPSIEYRYNNRGFRDSEWPEDLSSAIWCIGDSFTVGLGNNVDDTWPRVLARRRGVRTINVAMNGASNDWIARRGKQIIKEVSPMVLIAHWSFIHRRELNDASLPDDRRRIWHKEELERLSNSQEVNLQNFIDNLSELENNKGSTRVIHTVIPAYSKEPKQNGHRLETELRISELGLKYFIPEFEILDYARDEIHYYNKTTSLFVDSIEKVLDSINKEAESC